MISDLVQVLGWSLFGLSLGWGMCKVVAEVEELKGAVVFHTGKPRNVGVRRSSTRGAPMKNEYTLQTSQRRWRIFGALLMVFALAVGITTWQSNNAIKDQAERDSRRTACQAQYNSDFASVVAKRAQWANEDKNAETKLWKDFLSSKPGEARGILQEYLNSVARTDRLRSATPLPKLGDRNC